MNGYSLWVKTLFDSLLISMEEIGSAFAGLLGHYTRNPCCAGR